MAVEQPSAGVVQMPVGAQVTQVTLSPEALCHYINDDELERLGDMRKEPVMEIFLCTVGAFLGALIPAFQELTKFQSAPDAVGFWGLATMFIAAMTLAVAAVTGWLWHQRSKTHKSMVETIRTREKRLVRFANENAA